MQSPPHLPPEPPDTLNRVPRSSIATQSPPTYAPPSPCTRRTLLFPDTPILDLISLPRQALSLLSTPPKTLSLRPSKTLSARLSNSARSSPSLFPGEDLRPVLGLPSARWAGPPLLWTRRRRTRIEGKEKNDTQLYAKKEEEEEEGRRGGAMRRTDGGQSHARMQCDAGRHRGAGIHATAAHVHQPEVFMMG